MPASAVARRTPAITGMFGTFFGARGETEEDIAGALMGSGYADARRGGRASQRVRYSSRHRSDSEFLLLRGRRHLAVGRLRIGRLGIGRGWDRRGWAPPPRCGARGRPPAGGR